MYKRAMVHAQRALERAEEAHREGVDCSWGRPSPESLIAAGKDFICLYLNDIPGFGMEKQDIERYSQGGIDLVSLFEKGAEDARRGYRVGLQHGTEAVMLAKRVGMPKNRPIFFAADFEAMGPETGPYFVGVNHALYNTGYVTGGYGDRMLMEWLFKEGLIVFGVQTYAWSHHMWDSEAKLRQVLINLPGAELEIGGSKVDYCKSTMADFGQWRVT